ncbi:MAG: undecaprenyldiphospho-muramoylpentapeptide beta-N-acetylglucosaminyltransferase [Rectinemataceae bacterium]
MKEGGNDKAPLLAFTGGGTGGHIYPGLAVIQALKDSGFKGRIAWIGSGKTLDRSIVEKEGVEYFAIPSGKLRRSLSLENIIDAFRVIGGYFAARRLLADLKPVLLFSKGGYVSVPPCRAAASLGIPYFTHESDASPGLATRLNARRAARILVSWPRTAAMLPFPLQAKTEVVGNPVRPSLLKGDPEKGRRFIGAPPGLPVVFFVGGSQGSRQINEIVTAVRPGLEGKAFIVHQTGRELFDPGQHGGKTGCYKALPYIGEEMSDIMAASTIVSGRAGAGTIWESAALGKPMVLIPLAGKGTRGDQVENAEMAEAAGAGICLKGALATPEKALAVILAYIEDPAALARAGEAGTALCKARNAVGDIELSAQHIARLILEQIGHSTGRRT